jgi:hypothetical protein
MVVNPNTWARVTRRRSQVPGPQPASRILIELAPVARRRVSYQGEPRPAGRHTRVGVGDLIDTSLIVGSRDGCGRTVMNDRNRVAESISAGQIVPQSRLGLWSAMRGDHEAPFSRFTSDETMRREPGRWFRQRLSNHWRLLLWQAHLC